ncbi:hypothetical protein ACCO45_012432 [Purpureocillium lilacinum]|uniref:Uncharacterized protein n=1 Tax=Purpureocillium lilacinum TaxID=33203 RepID=A0ACC4D861_PURLI
MLGGKLVVFSDIDKAGVDLVGAPILVDDLDFPGVKIAAGNLAEDFARATGGSSSSINTVFNANQVAGSGISKIAIIVGCIKVSRLLQRLQREGQVDFEPIKGKWESFLTAVVRNPLGGTYEKALVIGGSDKRGAIFGTLPASSQDHPENLTAVCKANFMWPAMWPGYPNPGANFFVDDPDNQRLADEYGIVISTSHHEPMQRLTNEWFLENEEGSWDWETNKESMTDFFRYGAQRAKEYESYFTVGIRGAYDRRMPGSDPAVTITDVINTQRRIIEDVYGRTENVPQVLALYRDIEHIYDGGRIEVPDDVTLLFQDDNNGTIRRLPGQKERARKGGAGIYYHFEYVGLPRSYKWTNSVALGKAWHQLQYAYSRNARQIWLFNVGDLKPLETPITWAMSLAWDINSIGAGNLPSFLRQTAIRDFGPELGSEIGKVYLGYNRLVSMRKHELIEPDTFSLLNYREAEIVLEQWEKLLTAAESAYRWCTEEQKPAVYQLVLHPVKSSQVFIALRIMQTRNQLYARQRRTSANTVAQKVLELFAADFDLQLEYHALLGGKWNHMLRQPHLGYERTWHAPSRDMITGLSYVQIRQDSNPIVGQMGVSVEGHVGVRPGLTNEESDRTHPSRLGLVAGLTLDAMSRYGPASRWFEIWSRGTPTIHWTASSPHSWLRLSSYSGILVPGRDDARIEISIDWDLVSEDFGEEVLIDVRSAIGDFEQIHLPVSGRKVPSTFHHGFVEGPGYVSMPGSSGVSSPDYIVLPDTGRSLHGSVGLNMTLGVNETSNFLSYQFYQFSTAASAKVILEFGITLSTSSDDLISYDLQVNDGPVTQHRIEQFTEKSIEYGLKLGVPRVAGWITGAADLVWKEEHEAADFGPGAQVIRLRLCHVNILLEKVVVDFGGVRESYLGPPASHWIETCADSHH